MARTLSDVARSCEGHIKRLCRPEDRDKWRAYTARELQKVMDEQAEAARISRWLADLEWFLRLRAEGDAAIAAAK